MGGHGVWRGLWATFGGGGGLGVIFRGGVRQGVGVEGACSSVGDCWKGLGISTPKCLWNSEAVGVQRMPKVSKVRIGKTPRCFQSRKQVIPWQGQSRAIVGRENIVHRTQTMCTYNAPKPEQKTVCKISYILRRYIWICISFIFSFI